MTYNINHLSLKWGCIMKKENEKLIQIAYAIKNEVKRKPSKNKGRYFNFIFLCGGAQYEGDNRALLKKLLSKREDIRCLYSENLFQLLDTNLLTFEELLFETSTNVIIIVESFGSACELGAFSYIDDSINKLIVINDADYKNEASFINDGPIKKIYDVNNNNVFFETFVYDTANHKRLILSSNLVNRLLDGIPINKSFLEKDILVENDVLKISDLSYFLLKKSEK